ncbi:MAG: substrate-binding domain-containing protein [Eubacteriales bacterium]|nr:substrate-binding domain-containing protein [Eubacteriales bacterium]
MKQTKFMAVLLVLLLALTVFAGCGQAEEVETPTEPVAAEIQGTLRLATTTSTQDSGLLDVLLPAFTFDTGWEAEVIAVGSGAAMEMGENGEADVLLVHSPAAEREFVAAGHGPERFDVMYNDFVIVGPKDDPAGIAENAGIDAVAAMKLLAENKVTFISRGDDSGTHKKELSLWEKAEITPAGDWYVSAGQGMGAVLTMANEKLAYTIADRATWLAYEAETDLAIVSEGDTTLFNQYGVIVVDPAKNEQINAEGALAFQTWILSDKAQGLIGEFGVEEFGQVLFTPNATGEPTVD